MGGLGGFIFPHKSKASQETDSVCLLIYAFPQHSGVFNFDFIIDLKEFFGQFEIERNIRFYRFQAINQ
jgi:hypothetical protein